MDGVHSQLEKSGVFGDTQTDRHGVIYFYVLLARGADEAPCDKGAFGVQSLWSCITYSSVHDWWNHDRRQQRSSAG